MDEQQRELPAWPIYAGSSMWRNGKLHEVIAVIGHDAGPGIVWASSEGGGTHEFPWTAEEAFSCVSDGLAKDEAEAMAQCSSHAEAVMRMNSDNGPSPAQKLCLWASFSPMLKSHLKRLQAAATDKAAA